jgi:hypothetical protein
MEAKRFPKHYTKQVVEIVEVMSLTDGKDIKLVGSMTLRNQLYAGDYDMNELVPVSSVDDAVNKFQKMISRLLTMKDVFVGDIKAGEVNEEPVRWNPKQCLKGFLMIDDRRFTLQDAFSSPTLTKVDVVGYTDQQRFQDFSCIYTFKQGSKVLNPIDLDPNKGLREDIQAYENEGNYFKVMKRMYAFARLKKQKKVLETLTPILNGDLGRIYSLLSDVSTILYLLENEEVVPFDKIQHEINGFRSRLGNISETDTLLSKEKPILNKLTVIENLPNTETGRDRLASILLSLVDTFEGILSKQGKDALSSIGLYPIPKEYLP